MANATSLVVVVSGPGGVGKSTIVEKLVARDAQLWLSRSWTTREKRQGEAADAYTVLEIEVDGAQQVKSLNQSALLLFVLPPSRQEQKARLHGRGDPDQKVEKRLKKAEEEEPVGKAIADYVIINDDLESTVEEMGRIIAYERIQRTAS